MAIDLKNRSTAHTATAASPNAKYLIVAGAIAIAFFASYSYAGATKGAAFAGNGAQAQFATGGGAAGGGGCGMSGGGAGGGGGCCGGGSSTPIPGEAKVEGRVQKITVDASNGYSPNEITLKAGVPTEITFGPGAGCLSSVIFPDAGIQQDITQGATIKLPAMDAGEYQWSCGMQMVFGKLIVK